MTALLPVDRGRGLVGAVGVLGLQDGIGLLVAWELMSLGGAWMILSERLAPIPRGP